MKSGKWARGLSAGVTLVFIACGGNSDGDGGGDIPLDALPGELSRVYCDVLEECLGEYLELIPMPDCAARLEKQIKNESFDAIEAAIDAGAVTYDPKLARTCIDATRAQGCDLFTHRSPEACDEALSGDVALGRACSINAECAGDAFCDLQAEMCPGVCASRRAAGGDCESSEGCQDGLTCQNLKCAKPAEAGAACGGSTGTECRNGLVCAGEDGTVAGTCAEPSTVTTGKLGDACDLTTLKLCDPSLSCVVDAPLTLPPTFSCKAKSASGGSCDRGYPEPCPTGEFCDVPPTTVTGGTCKPLPTAGEACLTDEIRAVQCTGSLVCVGNTCKERNPNGASCATGIECYSERCSAGVCVGDEFCTAP